MLLSTALAKQGFFYNIWAEGDPKDWLKIEAKLSECRHISPEEIERELRNMSAAVFDREYCNKFDSLESRFFDLASVGAAFGAVTVATPPAAPVDEEPDPIVITISASVSVTVQLDLNDPINWSRQNATWIIDADLGFMVDQWGMPQRVVGVVDIKQYPLGTAFETFADDLVAQTRKFPAAKIVRDLTNNSAMAGLVSSRLGRNPVNISSPRSSRTPRRTH